MFSVLGVEKPVVFCCAMGDKVNVYPEEVYTLRYITTDCTHRVQTGTGGGAPSHTHTLANTGGNFHTCHTDCSLQDTALHVEVKLPVLWAEKTTSRCQSSPNQHRPLFSEWEKMGITLQMEKIVEKP